MASSSVTEAKIRSEIARLTATINERKSMISGQNSGYARTNSRNNTYINPNYKPLNKYIRPDHNTVQHQPPPLQFQAQVKPPSTQVKDVVLNGVAFESSGRSLVRKDLPKPSSSGPSVLKITSQHEVPFKRKSGHLIPSSRMYKPKSIHSRRGRPANRNMTLKNTIRPYQPRIKRVKYSDKPCPRFTTTGALRSGFKELRPFGLLKHRFFFRPNTCSRRCTGACSRGLTCLYQHDPAKIAICWNFLQGSCSYTAETCGLSHDPTPERTPLCLHYLNKGRCTRDNCPFPHVNVGVREGVCRDFAVLGYCEKGLDCDKQHVRECPDFAEKGTCSTKGCKLPHVIRANRARKSTAKSTDHSAAPTAGIVTTDTFEEQQPIADNAQLGDEYISLTFKESESESEEEDSDEEESEEDQDQDQDQEGSDPQPDPL